jgi:hypothetical protein
MTVNWDAVQKALYPVKDYEDLLGRLRGSFAFAFVREKYNLALPDLAAYMRRMLEGDARGRYREYAAWLAATVTALQQAGVRDVLDLLERTATRESLDAFVAHSGVGAVETAGVLKFLLYWCVPMEKYLSGLVQGDGEMRTALKALSAAGVRTNLDLLERGRNAAGRQELAQASGLAEDDVTRLVNLADFSRLPWASKATIANIIGAGYPSLARLAQAEPGQLYADFFRYGEAIGKNLKHGNEIESSYRIAQIVPAVVEE